MQYVAENQMALVDYDKNYVTEAKIRNHSAMNSLLMGQATRHEVDVIAAAYNMVYGLSHVLDVPAPTMAIYQDLLDRSSMAFKELCLRANKLGKPIAKAMEIATLNEMIDALDDLLDVVSVRQFELGVKYAIGHSKKASRREVVVLN